MAQPRVPLAERLERYVVRTATCWLWYGAVTRTGYGRVNAGAPSRSNIAAHRAMYELLVGPIPEGMSLHHTCNVRRCVNPAHHVPMPIGANVLLNAGPSANNARKTHCSRCGGPFAYRADGHRVCLPCKAKYQQQYFARKYRDPAWRAAWIARVRQWQRAHEP
jgi:hypothetical protein